ncbi:hypothetical protein EHEL_070425 [Encephalitozoon hellem ATCC 50504]|uniref:Uncharacterized protein n=1 Tax=Encephalitozoon hellem TaxID=27973 RepID=A0A9Q9CAT6_ENCHE|nr:uncharacterized protein EHEL_070425 [Encephalitozoon hellem ATCC 50504]AHL28947.1 hypothetical protein EHEL_070425 [Encephalitozoon hellem ATCC 50504]UTX43513.1 hypothetical protein GPU96_07g12720 [Encephalitozoon hellem]WEL38987.1 hypothetical protein PFJ87_07g00640 [Encephalitozoon hellem]
MRMKFAAEKSISLYDVDDEKQANIVTIKEKEKVLILSADEEIALNKQNIENDVYYDAKKAFLLGGKERLEEKLVSLDLDDEQKLILSDLIMSKEVKE